MSNKLWLPLKRLDVPERIGARPRYIVLGYGCGALVMYVLRATGLFAYFLHPRLLCAWPGYLEIWDLNDTLTGLRGRHASIEQPTIQLETKGSILYDRLVVDGDHYLVPFAIRQQAEDVIHLVSQNGSSSSPPAARPVDTDIVVSRYDRTQRAIGLGIAAVVVTAFAALVVMLLLGR